MSDRIADVQRDKILAEIAEVFKEFELAPKTEAEFFMPIFKEYCDFRSLGFNELKDQPVAGKHPFLSKERYLNLCFKIADVFQNNGLEFKYVEEYNDVSVILDRLLKRMTVSVQDFRLDSQTLFEARQKYDQKKKE